MKCTAIAIWVSIGCGLLAAGQDISLTVQLQTRLSTATSHKGDSITARVVQPPEFQRDFVTGHVTEVKTGNKIHGEAVLHFNFDTLQHGAEAIPISAHVTTMTNSKGQANVDEEGRVVRKTSNVGKALGGTGLGALIGGVAGGVKGAAIGAGAGAVASLVLIQVIAQGPEVDFAPGSEIGLSAQSRGGPDLATLKPEPAPRMAQAVAPAPATQTPVRAAAQADKTGAGASSDQPELSAVKIDFIPGEKTIFSDDFSDMVEDEPPPHWKVRGGKFELRKGSGIRQLTTVCPASPAISSQTFAMPKNFTMEIEAAFGGVYPSLDFYAWPKDVDGGEAPSWEIRISPHDISVVGPKGEKIGDRHMDPAPVNKPIKIALWVQEGRARAYVDGERIGDVNQMFLPADVKAPDHWTVRERCDRPGDGWIGLRSVRLAESAPDFSAVISGSGRYITHGIQFDTDSDRLKPESAPVIKAVARGLEKNPNLKLTVEGYTDGTGDAQHNLDLSKRRAEAVRSVLVSQFGVDAGRLTAAGLGPAKPIGSNDTAEGRAENRRVEFVKQ